MSNLLGKSLGRYRILEQLGEGGMATVYKAYDTRLERDVAVKIIRTEKLAQETIWRALKRFEREAKALAKLNHPNIVQVIDYGEHEGKPYLVMPLLEGGTLKAQIRNGRISWLKAMEIALHIASALEYAHQLKIIHRDIKPSNILIAQNGEPMLSDFGIAKILEIEETAELTGTGIGLGTPEYMSPEQFEGRADARTDIYALGVVLYEMVTGRKPYMADTPAAVIIKQATDPLTRPKQFAKDLPDAIEKILFKALAKKPDDRFHDMGQFANALRQIILVNKKQEARNTQRKDAIDSAVKSCRSLAGNSAKTITSARGIKPTSKQARTFWIVPFVLVTIFGLTWLTRQSSPSATSLLPDLRAVLPFGATSTLTATSTSTSIPTSTRTSSPTRKPTQTPSITPTPVYTKGNVLFEDDFEDKNLSGWTIPAGSTSTWNIQQETDGNHVLTGSSGRGREISLSRLNGNWANYVLEMDFKFTKRAGGGFEIAFRIHDPCNNYIAGFADGWFIGSANGCESFTGLAGDLFHSFKMFTWYILRIAAYQSKIAIFINDTPLEILEDTNHERGGISLNVDAWSEVQFDNIRVIELVSR